MLFVNCLCILIKWDWLQLWGKMRCRQILLLRIQFNDNTYFQFLNAKKMEPMINICILFTCPGEMFQSWKLKHSWKYVPQHSMKITHDGTTTLHHSMKKRKIFIVPLLPHNQSVQILFNFLPLLHYLLFTLNVCLFGNYKKSKA